MNFEKIVLDYFEGKLEEKAKAELLLSLKEDSEKRKLFYNLKLIWDHAGIGVNNNACRTDEEWIKITEKIKPGVEESFRKKSIRPLINFLKYAAIFIMGIGLAYSVIFFSQKKSDSQLLADNEIIVNKGQKSQVVLSDGTKIWLNSETRLKYPSQFSLTGSRDVQLEGEAYFEVAKKDKQPFNVKTSSLNIKVLGTSFNVKCYPGDKTVETTLIEGSVSLQATYEGNTNDIVLKPNQKAVYHKSNCHIDVSELIARTEFSDEKSADLKQLSSKTAKSVIVWKEQVLNFENESFEEIVVKLERWYGYAIIVNDVELLTHRYRGRFANYETIYQVLDAIRLTTPIDYTVNNKTINISKRPK